MSGKQKTHCKRGHELSGENLYVWPGHPTVRRCRRCQELRGRQRGLRRIANPEARERRRLANARYYDQHGDELRLKRHEPGAKARRAGNDANRRRRIQSDPDLRLKRALINKRSREKCRDRLRATLLASKPMPDAVVAALRQIIDHYWDDELRDYDARDSPTGHIFEALAEADEWLGEVTATP